VFDDIASQGDGNLDKEEVGRLLKMMDSKKYSKTKAIEDAMVQMDPNGDEKVDFDEFEAWWTEHAGEMPTGTVPQWITAIDDAIEKATGERPDRQKMPESGGVPPPPEPPALEEDGDALALDNKGAESQPEQRDSNNEEEADETGEEGGSLEEAVKLFQAPTSTPADKIFTRARAIGILQRALVAGRVKAFAIDKATAMLDHAKTKQATELKELEEAGWPLPLLLTGLTERLDATGGLSTNGVFRVPAAVAEVNELQQQLFPSDGVDAAGDVVREVLAAVTDPHVLAALLGRWLRVRRAVRLPKLQLTLFGRIGEATDDADATLLVHQLMIKVI
jgi:hypothetical protein